MLRRFPLVLAAAIASVAQTAPALSGEARRRNLESFDYIWKTVRENHWDPKVVGEAWDAARTTFRPRVEAADSMAAVRAALGEMLAGLKQSHFAVLPTDAYGETQTHPAGEGWTGIELRVIGKQVLVTAVEAGTAAAREGVRPGWEVLEVDGAEIRPALESLEKAYKDSTLHDLMLARSIAARLKGREGSAVRVRFLDGANAAVEKRLERGAPKGAVTTLGNLPPQYVWAEARELQGGAGYLSFNMFLDPGRVMPVLADGIGKFLKAPGIVIDLRGNPGGIGLMASGVAGWFIDRPNQRLGTMVMRRQPLQFIVNPRQPAYRGPLAVLVDGTSASTSEIFAGGLQDLKRARIFGTRTAGAALPSLIERLPNGDGFQYAAANYISEGGKELEGIGVAPDEVVSPSRESLLAGRDAVLDAALAWVRNQNRSKNGE